MRESINERQITEIYNRHVDTVYRLCYSYMNNANDTEDMVQETFLRLIRSGKVFENQQHEKAWLIVTASNLCKDQLKRWWRKTVPLEEQVTVADSPDRDRDVLQAVVSLPADYKAVVYLYYYEGYTTEQIAKFLHCRESTVRSRLTRARKKLRSYLGGMSDE